MKKRKLINIIVLSIALLAAGVSIYGIFSNQVINETQIVSTIYGDSVRLYGRGLYHNESISMAAQVRAQDMVTLFIGVPALLYSLVSSNRRGLRGQFLLTGVLGYFLYTYVSYCFVAMYNNFFLLFIILMSLSLWGFILSITSIAFERQENYLNELPFRRYLSYSLILFGIAIGLMWLGRIVPNLMKGLPAEGLEHYTTLPIQALDLGIIVPITIISGILLLRKNKLGYLLAPILIIKGITMLLAVDAMVISMLISGAPVSLIELVVFPLFTLIFCINLFLVLKNI